MIRYVLRRVLLLAASLLAASALTFLLLSTLPGNPARTMLGVEATEEQVAELSRQLGTDQPTPIRYLNWLGDLLTGDLGQSYASGQPVGPEILSRMAVTLPLGLSAFVLSVLIAVPLGVWAALRHRSVVGLVVSAISQLGVAVPIFWVGIMLVAVFALNLGWAPPGGFPVAGWAEPVAALQSLVLPVITLAVAQASSLLRYVRSATLDVVNQDFLRTARSVGLTRSQALWRHGLRNASVPVLSILGVQLAGSLLGAVIVESVFTLPGLGRMLLTDVGNRDLVKVQATVFLMTSVVLIVGFAVDVAQRAVDPRLRAAR
ncbi:ABC transporter permease [Actinoalloteichus hymeniacidonis]|uniref:ABC-type dipeptide/oligopeptide/nickel transport system, permease component n=1 Tax=Actinoalloteichus hymeniacidonis TaxID=340345 RepID=A0AAC9HUE2_9PSEU|nr:ABC transporter permease [Actinoalloteichus hymeniacidonis]AOS64685.1 ABC-type dipeptide/oligopeptide/nickel transport system, permease component [Actinoalloteichus hymeniacidonis]MBB5907240.1 peptide/nickel transport system permease protein [Actinoalloteichus hymeniacidonis]